MGSEQHRTVFLRLGADRLLQTLLSTRSGLYSRGERDSLLASSRRALVCISDVKLHGAMKEICQLDSLSGAEMNTDVGKHLRQYLCNFLDAGQ